MKRLFVGMLFLGLANLAYPQNSDNGSKEIKLSDVEVTSMNYPYLEEVQEDTPSENVLILEKIASRYNVKESPFFTGSNNLAKVKFVHKKGTIFATYNPNGKILSTNEWYKDIALPTSVREKVFSTMPNCTMLKNIYSVNYDHKKGAKKMYKIQVEQDGQKINFKFDSEGNPI